MANPADFPLASSHNFGRQLLNDISLSLFIYNLYVYMLYIYVYMLYTHINCTSRYLYLCAIGCLSLENPD